ncbi:MAG: energy transducer TonB [Steroidobacteraceae bacterium]
MAHSAPSESRDSAGDTAGATASAAARAPVDLAALTHHDDFLLELGEVLGGRASVHPADSLEIALEHLDGARGGQILAIDAREAENVRADVERACAHNPHAVIIVFTAAGAEKSVAAAVKGTRVFTVLPLPIEPGKTSAVLDAALADAAEKAAPRSAPLRSVRQAAEAPHTPLPAEPDAGFAEPPSGDRRKRLWLPLGAGVVAVAVVASLLLWPKHHVVAAHPVLQRPIASAAAQGAHFAALPRPDVDTSIVQGRVEDLLVKASRAMFARHFTAPKGDNALVFYRSVLAVDPTNGEARDGLRRVGNVVISRFKDAIRQGHYNAAALALATLQLADPTNRHVHPFGIELSSAVVNQALSGGQISTAPALIAQAARRGVPAAQIAAWQSQLTTLTNHKHTQKLVRELTRRIAAQRLTGPASATSTLAKLRTLDPKSTTTANATQALIGALLNQARQAGLSGQGAVERQALAAARVNGASAATIAAVQAQIQSARTNAVQNRLQRLLAEAHARLDAGELLQPAHDSAAYYLNALAADHPDPATAAAANQVHRALANALLQRADAAARAGQHSAAVTDLADARQWGASGAALHAATLVVDTPQPPTAAQLADVARSLRRTHYVSPSYPENALARHISGQVTVQYVVDPTGRPRHIKVVAAEPAMVFDRAALEAIRRWRYAPPTFHGQPVSVPVRTLIRFVLPN